MHAYASVRHGLAEIASLRIPRASIRGIRKRTSLFALRLTEGQPPPVHSGGVSRSPSKGPARRGFVLTHLSPQPPSPPPDPHAFAPSHAQPQLPPLLVPPDNAMISVGTAWHEESDEEAAPEDPHKDKGAEELGDGVWSKFDKCGSVVQPVPCPGSASSLYEGPTPRVRCIRAHVKGRVDMTLERYPRV
ncbi:hypothetical protein OH76DRAFT_1560200 [Lentinus brumalis]|uniref:Uncharacterized protein n=1 Tax=Lentinus brumalis TaxID=2498619 RepID=A0A371CTS4_9APHY|nr:hypothetical protein OH76DRAFT_1560200 [Polyporus brumalis]